MKLPIVIVSIFFLIFGIENYNLAFLNEIVNEERNESYAACMRLRSKVPNLNLKCEHLLDTMNKKGESQRKVKINNTEIKTLNIDESNTRKVNKSEEIKLRNLIKKLSKVNNQRKD